MKIVRPALLALAVSAAGGSAHATVVNNAVAIQVIDVCNTATDCALPNNVLPQDFITTLQNIYTQANVVASVLPTVTQFINPQFSTISSTDNTFNAGNCAFTNTNFPSFCELSRTPGHGQSADPSTINLYVVKKIVSGNGTSYGVGWINGNGVAVSQQMLAGFNPDPAGSTNRLDTPAHEFGHNLGLDHTTFGAGGSTNLMTNGTGRLIPTSPTDTATQTNPTGKDQLNAAQQGAVQASAFLTGIPLISFKSTDNVVPPGTESFPPPVHIHVSFDQGSPSIQLKQLFFNVSTADGDFTHLIVSNLLNSGLTSLAAHTIDANGSVLELDFTGFDKGDSVDFDLDATESCDCSFDTENLFGSRVGYIFTSNFRGAGSLDSTGNSTSNDLIIGGPGDPFIGPTGYFDTPNNPPRTLPEGLFAADLDPDDAVRIPEPSSLLLLMASLLLMAPLLRAARRSP